MALTKCVLRNISAIKIWVQFGKCRSITSTANNSAYYKDPQPYRREWYSRVPKKYWHPRPPLTHDGLPPEVVSSNTKVVSTTDSLAAKGFCRPQKTYEPPENVESKLKTICSSVIGAKLANAWMTTALVNSFIKYKVLAECSKVFHHDVPNSCLHRMKTLGNVLDYYKTPVEGILSYDQMAQQQDKLPPNLHVIPNPLRFHSDTDTLFKGITAYPKSSTIVTGLKTRKKYPGYEADFKWPDI